MLCFRGARSHVKCNNTRTLINHSYINVHYTTLETIDTLSRHISILTTSKSMASVLTPTSINMTS